MINFKEIPASDKTNIVAMQLYPYCTKENARRHLTHYIRCNQKLYDDLVRLGWSISDKIIYRPHIIAIYRYMGLLND